MAKPSFTEANPLRQRSKLFFPFSASVSEEPEKKAPRRDPVVAEAVEEPAPAWTAVHAFTFGTFLYVMLTLAMNLFASLMLMRTDFVCEKGENIVG